MIYLMRHGEAATSGRRYLGQRDVALTAEGVRQARAWSRRLAGVPFTAIYASDLERTMETASILAGGRPVVAEPALREIRLGEWEGAAMGEVRRSDPEGWEARGRSPDRFRPPGGESFADLRDRALPAFSGIVERETDPVLVVTHAGVIRVLLCQVLGAPLAHLFRFRQDPAALNLIDRSGGRPVVAALNLTPDRPKGNVP